MRVAWSAFLVALGLILYAATDLPLVHAGGLILMIAGDAGLLLALVGQQVWSRRARRGVASDDRGVTTQPVGKTSR